MRITNILAYTLLALSLVACSSIEIRSTAIDEFAAGNYQYYRWRTLPLKNTANSSDTIYLMDPIMRKQVNAELQSRGYVMDEERAQFSVDYLFGPGMRMGEKSQQASNIGTYPSVTPNRQADGASVDNAIALGGVKETSNIALQFNDVKTNEEIWRVIMTKFVENANSIDADRFTDNLGKAISKALKTLPAAH